jgi:hypothetical protein
MCMKLEIALYGRRPTPNPKAGLEVASRPRPRRDSRRTNSPGLPYSKSYSTRCIKSRRGRLFLHPSRPQRIAADCVSASSPSLTHSGLTQTHHTLTHADCDPDRPCRPAPRPIPPALRGALHPSVRRFRRRFHTRSWFASPPARRRLHY